MATTLYNLLAQAPEGEDYYIGQSPYYNAAKQIAASDNPTYEDNTQALLIPLLKGLVVGGLAGYGKKTAKEEAYRDYTKMLSSLNQEEQKKDLDAAGVEGIGPVANASLYEKLLAGEPQIKEAKDYSYKQGQMEILSRILQRQASDELEQKKAEKKAELELQLETFPFKLKQIEEEEKAKAAGKKAGEMATAAGGKGIEDLPVGAQDKITSASAVTESLREIKAKFDSMKGVSAATLQAKSYIPGTKEEQAMNQLQSQIPSLLRALGESGALSDTDMANAKATLKGNLLSSPKDISNRLNNIITLIKKKSVAVIDDYESGAGAGGLQRLKTNLSAGESSTPSASSIPSVGSMFNGQRVVSVKKIK